MFATLREQVLLTAHGGGQGSSPTGGALWGKRRNNMTILVIGILQALIFIAGYLTGYSMGGKQ